MSTGYGDPGGWEERWSRALAQHGDALARRPPNGHLVGEAAGLPPGRALDAGCGHGAEALWLAGRGWTVTAVDFAATALAYARDAAAAAGPEIAGRVDWLQADLSAWEPPAGAFDLVVCLYVHITGPVGGMVRRMASAVAPGGTLLMAGHRPVDPDTGEATASAGQVHVSVDEALAVLGPDAWEILVAEDRRRAQPPGGVDAVIVARRRP
ncbi:MAG: class I SAM-dependent methyltransferase [Thermoleophilia bacterium]